MDDELYTRLRVLSDKGIIISLIFEQHDMMHIRINDRNYKLSYDALLCHDALLESVSDRVSIINKAIDEGLKILQDTVNRNAMRS